MALSVPVGFTNASSAYRRNAWLALFGLLAFLLIYFALASWFAYITYRMFLGAWVGGGGSAVISVLAGLPTLFLAVFMWKAFFFVRSGSAEPGIEITAAEQPELFQFIYGLADELHAPRPYRVYLSPEVNASVFYDLTLLNLVLPSRKNLIIGLGLVNSLTESEFKAVLAHEFGHFAQRTMAVGRYVYIGEQIAGHIIAKRDFLDRMLEFIAAIDLRVAWIGWIMQTVVWSIRSLMETVFGWVVLAHRALGREMEFQADRVAVSVTGSDALIHGLYRLQPADQNWQLSLGFLNSQLHSKKRIPDIFSVQSRIGQHLRRILAEPHGQVPPLPTSNLAEHRVFDEEIAQPPKMWATHPPNNEREKNAKEIYIPAPLSDESAWRLFENPLFQCERVTDFMLSAIPEDSGIQRISREESLKLVDEEYAKQHFDRRYRGAYLGRGLSLAHRSHKELIGELPDRSSISTNLQHLYGEVLQEDISRLRKLDDEIGMLQGVQRGDFVATGSVLRHRGRVISKKQLPEVIEQVQTERDAKLQEIEQHDQLCRSTHNSAARYVAHGWQDYHASLVQSLHYIEHGRADFEDAAGHLANVTQITIASGGNVSETKLNRLLDSANDLRAVMQALYRNRERVGLPASAIENEEVKTWLDPEEFRFELPGADAGNINSWMQVIDSWVDGFRTSFAAQRECVLEELLLTEQKIAKMYQGEEEVVPAPKPLDTTQDVRLRVRGTERKRQEKLGVWARFTNAYGMGPAIARFVVALMIVGSTVGVSSLFRRTTLYVYNGLETNVSVQVGSETLSLAPRQSRKLTLAASKTLISAQTQDGREIETFEESLTASFSNYVYNVASASPMIQWTASYGNAAEVPPDYIGFRRVWQTNANHIFEQPPMSVETEGKGTTRTVFEIKKDGSPIDLISFAASPEQMQKAILAHCLWDSTEHQNTPTWLYYAEKFFEDSNGYIEILEQRLATTPLDVVLLRLVQDRARENADEETLAKHRRLADENPGNADMRYVAIRAQEEGAEQDEALLAALQEFPENGWLRMACGYVHSGRNQWDRALELFESSVSLRGPMSSISAVDVLRIRRLLAPDLDELQFGDLKWSYQIRLLDAMQNDGEALIPQQDYAGRIYRGELDSASYLLGQLGSGDYQVMLACSEGAKQEWIDDCLDRPMDEVKEYDDLAFWIALAHREGRATEVALEAWKAKADRAEKELIAIVQLLIAEGPVDALDAEIAELSLGYRAEARSIAVVMYPEETPSAWRSEAVRLGLPSERPFLKLPDN